MYHGPHLRDLGRSLVLYRQGDRAEVSLADALQATYKSEFSPEIKVTAGICKILATITFVTPEGHKRTRQ